MQDTIWANEGELKIIAVCHLPWVENPVTGRRHSDFDTEQANANLVATAPELLDALSLLEKSASCCVLDINPKHDAKACALTQALILAREVLIKATS